MYSRPEYGLQIIILPYVEVGWWRSRSRSMCTSKGEGEVLCSLFFCNVKCCMWVWNLTLTSNFSSRLKVWSLFSFVSFLLLDKRRSLFVLEAFCKVRKTGIVFWIVYSNFVNSNWIISKIRRWRSRMICSEIFR